MPADSYNSDSVPRTLVVRWMASRTFDVLPGFHASLSCDHGTWTLDHLAFRYRQQAWPVSRSSDGRSRRGLGIVDLEAEFLRGERNASPRWILA